jgi:hypothetical protein
MTAKEIQKLDYVRAIRSTWRKPMRIQCGVPGIATSAMLEARAPKKLPRSTKRLTQRKVTWKGTTQQIIGCEGTPSP